MEQPAQETEVGMGFTSAAQTSRPAAAVTGAPVTGMIHPAFAVPPHHPLPYPQVPQFQHPQLQQLLKEFWCKQMQEIERTTDHKNHSLPLARIRKIMKATEEVRMISSDAPVIFSKACEIFIRELMLRSWFHTEENGRRTLQKKDLVRAISGSDMFDFLVDIVPKDDFKKEFPKDDIKKKSAKIPRSAREPVIQMSYWYMPTYADPVAATAAAEANEEEPPAPASASASAPAAKAASDA